MLKSFILIKNRFSLLLLLLVVLKKFHPEQNTLKSFILIKNRFSFLLLLLVVLKKISSRAKHAHLTLSLLIEVKKGLFQSE